MSTDLEIVARCQFLPEAEAIRLHLEEHDIPVFLADAEIVNMDWLLGNAVGNIKVQVPVDRAAEARQLLDEMKARSSADDDDADDEAEYADDEDDEATPEPAAGTPCLSCGAPLASGVSTCASCGWSYAADGAEPDDDHAADDDDYAPYESTMNDLTYLKRPLFVFYLVPLLAIVLLGIAWALVTVAGCVD